MPLSRSIWPHAGSPLTGLDRATWPAGKPHGVVRKPPIGLAIVGADELGPARQGLVALRDVAVAGLPRVGIGPRANQEASLHQPLNLVEVFDRIVDLEPGGRRVFGRDASQTSRDP